MREKSRGSRLLQTMDARRAPGAYQNRHGVRDGDPGRYTLSEFRVQARAPENRVRTARTEPYDVCRHHTSGFTSEVPSPRTHNAQTKKRTRLTCSLEPDPTHSPTPGMRVRRPHQAIPNHRTPDGREARTQGSGGSRETGRQGGPETREMPG